MVDMPLCSPPLSYQPYLPLKSHSCLSTTTPVPLPLFTVGTPLVVRSRRFLFQSRVSCSSKERLIGKIISCPSKAFGTILRISFFGLVDERLAIFSGLGLTVCYTKARAIVRDRLYHKHNQYDFYCRFGCFVLGSDRSLSPICPTLRWTVVEWNLQNLMFRQIHQPVTLAAPIGWHQDIYHQYTGKTHNLPPVVSVPIRFQSYRIFLAYFVPGPLSQVPVHLFQCQRIPFLMKRILEIGTDVCQVAVISQQAL